MLEAQNEDLTEELTLFVQTDEKIRSDLNKSQRIEDLKQRNREELEILGMRKFAD